MTVLYKNCPGISESDMRDMRRNRKTFAILQNIYSIPSVFSVYLSIWVVFYDLLAN